MKRIQIDIIFPSGLSKPPRDSEISGLLVSFPLKSLRENDLILFLASKLYLVLDHSVVADLLLYMKKQMKAYMKHAAKDDTLAKKYPQHTLY